MIILLLCATAALSGAQMMGAGGGAGPAAGILAPPAAIPGPPAFPPAAVVPGLGILAPAPPIPAPPAALPAVPQWMLVAPNAAVGRFHWHAGPGDIVTWLPTSVVVLPGMPDSTLISLLPLTLPVGCNSLSSPEVWLARDPITALRRACYRHFEVFLNNIFFKDMSTK